MQFRTRAIHVGQEKDPATGAVVRPIHIASTSVQPAAGEWLEFHYGRSGNPTRKALETTVASLEGCSAEGGALAFATGMAATHCVVASLSAGDHVLAGCDLYGGTYRLLHQVANRAGVEVTLLDATNLAEFEKGFQDNTKLVWVESPGNPLLSIVDYAAVAELAHKHGAVMGCDNTFSTPVLTRPLELGVDHEVLRRPQRPDGRSAGDQQQGALRRPRVPAERDRWRHGAARVLPLLARHQDDGAQG